MSSSSAVFVASILMLNTVHSPGCCFIGYRIGASVDASDHDTSWVVGFSDWEMEHNDSTAIKMKNGTTLNGRFQRIADLPDSLYERGYREATLLGLGLPRMHDTVEVIRSQGASGQRNMSGEFLGFGIDPAMGGTVVRIGRGSEVKSYGLKGVKTISDFQGREWKGKDLSEAVDRGAVPLDRGVRARIASADTLLAVSDIDSIWVRSRPGWRWVGLGIGIAVDVAAVIALSAYDNFDFTIWENSR